MNTFDFGKLINTASISTYLFTNTVLLLIIVFNITEKELKKDIQFS